MLTANENMIPNTNGGIRILTLGLRTRRGGIPAGPHRLVVLGATVSPTAPAIDARPISAPQLEAVVLVDQ